MLGRPCDVGRVQKIIVMNVEPVKLASMDIVGFFKNRRCRGFGGVGSPRWSVCEVLKEYTFTTTYIQHL